MGLSREEDILQAVIDGVPYTGSPLSRIESLLVKIAQVGLHSMKKEVVDVLPQPGEDDILYLLRKHDGDAGNWCEEYIWLDNDYELIGNTKTDLTGYATEQWVTGELASYVKSSTFDTVLSGKVDKEAGKGLFSGSYNDLKDTPTIPSTAGLASETYVNNAVSNKVDKEAGKGLFSGSYNDLNDKPTIPEPGNPDVGLKVLNGKICVSYDSED